MHTKPSYWAELASGSTAKVIEKHSWCLHATAPRVHLFIGVVCAVIALPLGLRAAALMPVAIGFAKGIFDHYVRNEADPADFAWIIAGAAMVVGCAKLADLA